MIASPSEYCEQVGNLGSAWLQPIVGGVMHFFVRVSTEVTLKPLGSALCLLQGRRCEKITLRVEERVGVMIVSVFTKSDVIKTWSRTVSLWAAHDKPEKVFSIGPW